MCWRGDFFNNVSTLNICIHGTIGLAATLALLVRIGPGAHRIDTPVGWGTATLCGNGTVEIDHVEVFGPLRDAALAESRNFALCPGKAYDRSPCGKPFSRSTHSRERFLGRVGVRSGGVLAGFRPNLENSGNLPLVRGDSI